MKLLEKLAVIVLFSLFLAPVVLAMSSANYQINWDSLNIGGEDTSSSTNYSIRDTLGEISTGSSSSTNYGIRAGYRQGTGEIPLLNFSLSTQDNSSQVSYSSFDNSNKQVAVSSASGFSVNDYIAVVENEGGSQLVALGKISSIGGTTITVDKWSGDNGSMSATPSGGDDYVYKLSGSAAQLGTLTTSAVKTAVTRLEITTNAENGYTATVYEDGNLRTTVGDDIDDVADGSVTAGSEEYGISSTGDDTTPANDFAITGSNTTVASSSTYGSLKRTAVIYQAAISDVTAAGSYSHTVTYVATGNF